MKKVRFLLLRAQTHAAFQCDGFAGHILEVLRSNLDTGSSNILFCASKPTHWRHMNIGGKGFRVSVLELLQLGSPGQGTDHIHMNAVRTPLSSCNTGETPDGLLGCCVTALSFVTEKTGTGGQHPEKFGIAGKLITAPWVFFKWG